MRYTKKPVTIEAIRFVGLTDFGDPQFDTAPTGGVVPNWLMDAMAGPEGASGSMWAAPGQPFIGEGDPPKELFVGTMEGQHIASKGDWIIRGIKGELYPCKPDIFDATYDPAQPDCPTLSAIHDDGIDALAKAHTVIIGDSDGTDGH